MRAHHRLSARARRSAGALASLALLACAAPPRDGPARARPSELLAPERIAALPDTERDAWTRYLFRSRDLRTADRAALQAELRSLGRHSPVPAPQNPALVVDSNLTDEWFQSQEARLLAESILSYQTPSGGWSKRIDFARPRAAGQSYSSEGSGYVATFDNDATTEQLRFLARAHDVSGDDRYRESLVRGLEFVLLAQFPNGCWPQVYPLQGGYHDAATLNDDAMVNILRLLRELEDHPSVPRPVRDRMRASVGLGVDCLMESQVVQDGRPAVWAAQYDPLTLRPVGARSYEHPSLSGRESAAVLLFLMDLEAPGPRVIRAVEAGVAWLREHAIHGLDYESKGDLVPREGAGPLWARFYELGTSRPIFSNRDGVVRYRWQELDDERRYGYAWYTDEPARVLRRYERWARRHQNTPR